MRCKLRPESHCAGCTHTRVHTHIRHIQLQLQGLSKPAQWQCRLNYLKSIKDQVSTRLSSSIRGWKPRQWTQRLCRALPCLLAVFRPMGPTDNCPSHKSTKKTSPFEARENIHAVPVLGYCCCCFFLLHGRGLEFQPVRRKVRRTRRTVPRACRTKRFGPRTQLRRSSSNCPNQNREVKVRPSKNKISSLNFFSGSPNFPN